MYAFLAVLPVGVEIPPDEEARTNAAFAFGGGSYASIVRSCEDSTPSDKDAVNFSDAGLQVDHRIASHVRLGLRGSYIADKEIYRNRVESRDVVVVNPFVKFEWPSVAFSAGFVHSGDGVTWASGYDSRPVNRLRPDVSLSLRLGKRSSFYFSTSLFNSLPAYSRGMFRLGFGGRLHPRVDIWAGMGSGPYVDLIGIGEIDYKLNRNIALTLAAGLGSAEGIRQGSLSTGLRFRFPD